MDRFFILLLPLLLLSEICVLLKLRQVRMLKRGRKKVTRQISANKRKDEKGGEIEKLYDRKKGPVRVT